MKNQVQRRDLYWAASAPEEMPALIDQRFEEYVQVLETTGRLDLYRKVYRTIYGMDREGRHITAEAARVGEQGELVSMKVNHARNLSNHIVNLTCQNRLSFDCRAKDTDSNSAAQTICGQQWLDDAVREKGAGQKLRKATKIATDFADAFVVVEWDRFAGRLVNVIEGRPIHAGDISVTAHYPDDVAREFYEEEGGKNSWHIVQTEENVHRLAAKYPEQREEILRLGERIEQRGQITPEHIATARDRTESDRTRVRRLYHDRTPELPEGRVVVVAGDLVLEDRKLTIEKEMYDGRGKVRMDVVELPYPVKRMRPEDQGKTSFGYTTTFDLLTINDLVDMLYSAAATNLNAGAVSNLWSPPNNNLANITHLATGLNLIELPVKPEIIELAKSPPELYQMIDVAETLLEVISGVNSVARGNPDGALKGASGSALALLQSMTIMFVSGLQEGYGVLAEEVGQAMMEYFQAFADEKRWIQVVGKNDQKYAREISRKDVAAVSKVEVDLGNPATRTYAGRKQLADEMLPAQMFESPQQYLTFLATGRFEHLVEHKTSQLMRIKKENEDLREGKSVKAVLTDPHPFEIKEHMSVLDDPEARRNPQLLQSVLAHIDEHLKLELSIPPAMRMVLGLPPIPQQALPPPTPGAPGGAPPPETTAAPPPPMPMPTGGVGEMPVMPTNPLTGEQAPAVPGPAA